MKRKTKWSWLVSIVMMLALSACSIKTEQTISEEEREIITPENVSQVEELMRLGEGTIEEIAWSPDGTMLAAAGSIGIHLYDSQSLEEIFFIESLSWLSSLAFAPNGATLASGSRDGIISLWDVESGDFKHKLSGHTGGVLSVAFSPDGRTLASGSYDDTIRLWDVESGVSKHKLVGHTDIVNSVAFSPDGQTLASGSSDSTIRFWEVENGVEFFQVHFVEHTDGVNSVAFSPDGSRLASGQQDGSIQILNVENLRTQQIWEILTSLETLEASDYPVESVAFSPDGTMLAAGGIGIEIGLWNVDSGEEICRLQSFRGWVSSVAFSPDGLIIASKFMNREIILWDVANAEEINNLESNIGIVESIAFSPDGLMIASDGSGYSVNLWDVESLR